MARQPYRHTTAHTSVARCGTGRCGRGAMTAVYGALRHGRYGTVRCGVGRCGMERCGTRCGAVHDVVWCVAVRSVAGRNVVVWYVAVYGASRCGAVWGVAARYGALRHGMVRCGAVRHGVVLLMVLFALKITSRHAARRSINYKSPVVYPDKRSTQHGRLHRVIVVEMIVLKSIHTCRRHDAP